MHGQYFAALEELKDAYAAFDPDADTAAPPGCRKSSSKARRAKLFERFEWLLERGNFVRLAQEDIERALDECSQWGVNLKVDFGIFDRLDVFCRGDVVGSAIDGGCATAFAPSRSKCRFTSDWW